MANIKSAIKRVEIAEARAKRNKAVRSQVKTAARKVVQAVAGGNTSSADEALRGAMSTIDRAASKGILHRRTAARKKSRLAKRINKMGA
ncbi:MAG TPA: 30S ribosomal protein S20 [Bacillota bacterium]|nr:30S ribosomal protein S20 [Bacillota bacterium]